MSNLHLLSPLGFRAAAVHAGIKSKKTGDVAVLVCEQPATAAAVFTTNRVFAAPIKIGRKHIARGALRGIAVNAGNANACTGKQGERDAIHMCELLAGQIDCNPKEILPSSTGIIGRMLPMDKIEKGILAACAQLGSSAEHATQFTDAILTTDTRRKTAAVEFNVGKKKVRIAGCCKGSGMIGPRMSLAGPPHATMLAYLTTDAALCAEHLQAVLSEAAEQSFNAVTVDDHMSTNDTAAILASGLSGAAIDTSAAQRTFAQAVREVCQSLAYQIAADGEGATKVVRIEVSGAKDVASAKIIARAIANSPLVKTAMHGNDPNWGRIISAAGYSGATFDPNRCTLVLQGITVFRTGQLVKFDPAKVSKALSATDVKVELQCGGGKSAATVWTCDLSKEYITINADYHT
ncbi:MAG TPA: bifunctional glutamate N-acetyltransferase/amino-acid acetyltransferase ArgJ [Tepidisphaeraceae bacterium]|jgi:glutamate N-acetyltransferase/amino-acid N-acetyltransferase